MDEVMKTASLDQLRAAVKPKNFPACTCLLVFMILTCHTLVLIGNHQTASAIGMIGVSTGGWSDVGLDISNSLQSELGEVMVDITTMLTDAINHTMYVQDMLDTVTGLLGHSAEALVSQNATKALLLFQMHGMVDSGQVPKELPGMITSSADAMIDMLVAKISKALRALMEKLKPALLQVGKLITRFGDKITTMLEHFSVTLDRVQKIFDQVMSQMATRFGNQEELMHETFNIFDVSNSGAITAKDLRNTAQIYSIPALQGSVADDLVRRYDSDKSADLSRDEFKLMVADPAIPHSMSVVLRSFAKSLSQVAGQVGGSHFRGEIAADVADYLELMAQKNMTKVSWIADALTNTSLPIEFSADIIANLALKVDNPNSLPVAVAGKVVVAEMMRLNSRQTSQAIDLLSNVTYWVEEGFAPSDNAEVVKRVTEWVTQPASRTNGVPIAGLENALKLLELEDSEETSTVISVGARTMVMERRLVSAMPAMAHKLAKERMHQHVMDREKTRRLKYDELFSTKISQHLLLHLMGGEPASQDSTSSPARQMVNGGIKAHPQTLRFAQWLSWNASSTANRFQKLCFANEATSSNTIDSFATQMQGMVKKIHGVIDMMMQYSTPDGVAALETTVESYANHAAADMAKLVKDKIGSLMNESLPALEAGLHEAVRSSGMKLGNQIAEALATPLAEGLAPSIVNMLKGVVSNASAARLGGELGRLLAGEISNINKASGNALGKQLVDVLEDFIDKGLASSARVLNNTLKKEASLVMWPAMPADIIIDASYVESLNPAHRALCADLEKGIGSALQQVEAALRHGMEGRFKSIAAAQVSTAHGKNALGDKLEEETMISGVWENLAQTLKSLTNVVPQANKALTFARKEIMMLAKNLDSVFVIFAEHGPPIFDNVNKQWRLVFTLYYFLMVTFALALLFYAFWAGGFRGGPGLPEDNERQTEASEPRTLLQKCMDCCCCCCYCLYGCHGSPAKSQLCFWSGCVLMQILVLVLFLVSLGFGLLTAVKMFLASGCQQIYLLGDHSICGTALLNVRQFLPTFMTHLSGQDAEFSTHCLDKNLLTCNLIGERMKTSGLITVVFSFLAALFTFQLLVESAAMHERAVNRTKIEQRLREKAED